MIPTNKELAAKFDLVEDEVETFSLCTRCGHHFSTAAASNRNVFRIGDSDSGLGFVCDPCRLERGVISLALAKGGRIKTR